jgi:hypothetical protein
MFVYKAPLRQQQSQGVGKEKKERKKKEQAKGNQAGNHEHVSVSRFSLRPLTSWLFYCVPLLFSRFS